MPPALSVIICTHDPVPNYLARTLAALRAQTLPVSEWELVVVDNCSELPLTGSLDLSWHPHGRIVVEEQLGLAHGRVRGLNATTGEIIVFIDDDNLCAPTYLEGVLAIARDWPMLGVWGGKVTPQFEAPPPAWILPFMHHLAVMGCEEPTWSSYVDDRNLPVGAGLCVRRAVADAYLEKSRTDPVHSRFGRTKKCAVAGDDQYICFCAERMGLGCGKFPQIMLEHIIPARRMTPQSFLRVARGNAHGAMLLRAFWQRRKTNRDKLYWPVLKTLGSLVLHRGMRRRIVMAEARGEFDAMLEARRMRCRAPARVAAPGGEVAATT